MIARFFKNLHRFCLLAVLLPASAFAQQGGVGVAAFTVNGPADLQYLSQAAQDAVVGALLKRGKTARSIVFKLDPDRLSSVVQGKGKDALVVAGRINIVGQTYRVLIKWVDISAQPNQEYLEVGDVNQLIPQLENFAAQRLKVSTVVSQPSVPAPAPRQEPPAFVQAPEPVVPTVAPVKSKPAKETKVTVYEEPVTTPPTAKPVKAAKVAGKPSSRVMPVPGESHEEYTTVSQRLPFEVRSLAYGDIDGDGQEEILLTSQKDLYAYRAQDGQLNQIGHYAGKNLDHFVKIGIWPAANAGKPYLVLTNLRGEQAASAILKFEAGQFVPVAQEISYQLRVLDWEGQPQLFGESYSGGASAKHQIYRMSFDGGKVKPAGKLEIPSEFGLYSFEFLSGDGVFSLAGLSPSGKLKLYKKEGNGKFKGTWTSRESYGGSANDVEVKVKDFFNEVVADYYVVPLGLRSFPGKGQPSLVVAKNDALLKEIVGRKPVISDGRMVQLDWSPLGMNEAWSSKKVDGSILDYQLRSVGGQTQLMVVVRMRDTGFFEGAGKRKDSVLLVYNLN